tara:strand:+ start:40 stop:609 length:570 start_codon:yes stop_codon:yes gene_type:complete
MALTKVRDGGTDFTGAISSMKLLLNATISSAVAEYDISSTYINSTYDSYHLIASLRPASDGPDLYGRFFVGGSIDTGNNYGYEGHPMDGGSTFSGGDTGYMRFNRYAIGSGSGEGTTIVSTLTDINSTVRPASWVGTQHGGYTSAAISGNPFANGHEIQNAGDVVNGARLYFSSGNIESGSIQLYGIVK